MKSKSPANRHLPDAVISGDAPTLGLDAAYFNAADIFTRVRESIYFKTWQLACHRSQVAAAGDYFCLSVFDQDLCVVRGEDGALRAFYNVCRHRGHKLLQGSGNKRRLICPYHAWTYGLDGALLHAPATENLKGFDSICLSPLRVEEFLGFVFVNLDANADNMDTAYPGVRDAVAALCPHVEDKKFAHMHSADEGCNWIIAVENYNECYHCKVVHRQFAKGVIDPSSYAIAPFGGGKVLRHSAKAASGDKAWYDTTGADYGSFFLWPSCALQCYPGGMLNTYHWQPLAVNDTRVFRGWYSDDGGVDETLQKVIALDRDTTFAEDLQLVKNVQRGVNSRGYRPGPLVVNPQGGINNELSIACLHQWLREAVDGE